MATRGLEGQIKGLANVLAICFVLAALGAGYWSVIRAPALTARDDNPRRVEAERRIRRGHILDHRGAPLVVSQAGPLGVWERVYLAPETAPVVGYYSINHGVGGIERAFDPQIRGETPLSLLEQLQAALLHLHPQGVSVTLTLDLALQQAADHSLGEWPGAVVLLDVRSGDVLALVSHPTFDPNTLEADWPTLQFDPRNPLINRATQGLYAPGAILQTVTLAAALEAGLAEPTTIYTDDLGVILTVEPPIACPGNPPKTRFTLAEAYTWPCSVQFARLGLQLGGEILADYTTRLGVGLSTGLPIDAATGRLLARGVWSDLLAARTAMGQGEVLVTPLEMALMVSTLANNGLRPAPRLVLQVGDEDVLPAGSPRQVLRVETAQAVQQILAQSMRASMPDAPATVAGYAGSADSGLPGAPPHAWFIGFAPVEAPRYAVAVIAEHGIDGWAVAAPVGVTVLNQALKTP
ncbi:MAG: penicillin-binding protein 2 [Anaerolineae bacterium]|nr:penicillin-binding protein 2 [Anaerolineae bacterium]